MTGTELLNILARLPSDDCDLPLWLVVLDGQRQPGGYYETERVFIQVHPEHRLLLKAQTEG